VLLWQVIVFERGDLLFIFNFHPSKTFEGYVFETQLKVLYYVVPSEELLQYQFTYGTTWVFHALLNVGPQ